MAQQRRQQQPVIRKVENLSASTVTFRIIFIEMFPIKQTFEGGGKSLNGHGFAKFNGMHYLLKFCEFTVF